MHKRANPQLHRTEDAAQSPHVLVFEIAAVAPTIYLHCKSILTFMQIFRNVKLGRRHGVLTISHLFAVDPHIHSRLNTAEMQNDVLRKHLVGGIEEGNVRSHGVSPCVCCPVARRFLSDIRTMAHERIVYIYIYRCTVALCLPVARHCNLIPLAHVVVCRLEAFGTFFGIRRPAEMPLSVERNNLLTLPLTRG